MQDVTERYYGGCVVLVRVYVACLRRLSTGNRGSVEPQHLVGAQDLTQYLSAEHRN